MQDSGHPFDWFAWMRDRRGGAIVLWPFLPRNSVFGLDQREGIGSAHFALPAGNIAIGFTTVLLELEQAQHEIAQGGHDVGASPSADEGGIFPQGHVAPVMGTVFERVPVSTDDLRYLPLGALGAGQAGDVVAVFLLLLDHLAFAQIVAVAPNGDELPAPA